jgi:hypothetical protein
MSEDYPAVKAELEQPFDPALVQWKPGALSKDRKRAMAMAFVETRPYMDRLDEAAPGQWQDRCRVAYLPDRAVVIAHVTVAGVTHSGEGECLFSNGKSPDENAVTSAGAQAFKRACTKHGLGRYLYRIPRVWVDYDPQRKCFTDQALAQLRRMLETGEVPSSRGRPPQRPPQRPRAQGHRAAGDGAGGERRNGKPKGNGSGNGNAAAVVVNFGKYKGQTLGAIARADLEYLEWLLENWQWEKGREAAAAVLAYHQAQTAQAGAGEQAAGAPPF